MFISDNYTYRADMEPFQINNPSGDNLSVNWIPYKTLIKFISGSSPRLTKFHLSSPLLEANVCNFVCQKVGKAFDDLPTVTKKALKQKSRRFLLSFQTKYELYCRHLDNLVKSDWASGNFQFPNKLPKVKTTQVQASSQTQDSQHAKQKRKKFKELSTRGQFLIAKGLREVYDPDALQFAASQTLKQTGKKDARFVFNKVNSATGLTAAKIRKTLESKNTVPVTKLTPSEGLAFLLNQNLTKAQYLALRLTSREKGADIWPSYHEILAAKLDTRPSDIEITDHSALVPLQQLLYHTTSRILEKYPSIENEMIQIASDNDDQLTATLIFKLGFDGSGSHHRHMQPDNQGDLPKVKSLVATQMVPLVLQTNTFGQTKKLWENPFPNSAHACRPIRLSFEKENDENVVQEFRRLKAEIQALEDFVVSQIPAITINFIGLLTLFDGKVISILTKPMLSL